jgi:hypothetical protein
MTTDPKYPDGIETRLESLWADYHRSLPDSEPGPDFMPGLWRKIDASQSTLSSIRRWSRGLVTAAAAAALVMMVFLALPSGHLSPVYTATYLDALAADQSPDRLAYADVVPHEDGNPQ